MRLHIVVVVLSVTVVSAALGGWGLGRQDSAVGSGVASQRLDARAAADVRKLLAAPRFEVNRG
ncbi:MAG TPA: hypothetical protein VNT54_16690, partial [Solirubrobacteraceae bacterium]|nr:hypothetical protein [Solirubrobacteraceae bacterium]